MRPYRSKLDVVAQRHGNPVALVHAPLLQASGKCVGVAVERLVREDCALVVRDDAVHGMSDVCRCLFGHSTLHQLHVC